MTPFPFPGQVTDTSLTLRADMSLYEWGQLMDLLGTLARGVQWHLADVYLHGERHWGDEATQYLSEPASVMLPLLYVAKQFPVERRRSSLSWAHHELVAHMGHLDQDYWLDVCEEKGWGLPELRKAVAKRAAR